MFEKWKNCKKVELINHDCLPILMLLYITLMLYVMLAYFMLLAALSSAVCLHNAFMPLIFTNVFCFHALSWFIDTLFVYLKYDLASCTVRFICWFFLILCSHRLFHYHCVRAMCSLEI